MLEEIESLERHYEVQIELLRQRAINIDKQNIDADFLLHLFSEIQDRRFARQKNRDTFELLSHTQMQKLVDFELYLRDCLKDYKGIRIPKNHKIPMNVPEQNGDFLATLYIKGQSLKDELTLVKADLKKVLQVLKLIQKESELVRLLTIKLGKKMSFANGILREISIDAYQAIKALELIDAGLQNAMESIYQSYEQLQEKIKEIATKLEKRMEKLLSESLLKDIGSS